TDVGCQSYLMDNNIDKEEWVKIKEKHLTIKTHIKDQRDKKIADSKDLSTDEIDQLQAKFVTQEPITADEMFAYEKFRLRRDYNWKNNINVEFVSDYHDQRNKKIY